MKSILKRSAGAVLAILAAAACNNARVSGTIEGAGNMQIEVNLLNINKFQAVDTISTDAAGNFSCKLEVSKGNPEFYYFCRNGRRLASVLVDAGDRIELKADTGKLQSQRQRGGGTLFFGRVRLQGFHR